MVSNRQFNDPKMPHLSKLKAPQPEFAIVVTKRRRGCNGASFSCKLNKNEDATFVPIITSVSCNRDGATDHL